MSSVSLPSFSNYGNYSSDNYGAHTLKFSIPGITLWFSYKTVVAFSTPTTGLVVTQNDWSTTTGKHLNWIDGGDKESRLPRKQFIEKLQSAMQSLGGE